MGHLVEQVEVDAIETRVSKATTGTTQSDSSPQASGQQQQQHVQQTPQQTHVQQQTQAHQQQQQQQQASTVRGRLGHDQHQRPPPQPCQPSLARKANAQKEEENGSPDKKQREGEAEGVEEDESGWWAERVVAVLGRMTGYRDTWYRSHAHLLHGDGPLPHTWRLYIAALAVCRHEVGWLMQALLGDFRSAGGDTRWLAGLHHAPPKFSALASINNILAHQPWLLSPQHIQQLTKGEDSWSLGELCQALCIMTHFHALATFLHGCGLSTYTIPKKEKDVITVDRNTCSSKSSSPCLQSRQSCPEAPESSTTNSSCKLNSRPDIRKATTVNETRHKQRVYAHLTLNPGFTYEDFNCNDESRIPSLSIQEYNWQDHGYAMCSRLAGEVGAFLDERFTSALTVAHVPTQTQLSKSNASCSPSTAILDQQNNPIPSSLMYDQTSPLPAKALWNYVQWLLGIHHDDCDYNALNKHLDPQLKAFIKTACCFPETLSDSKTMTTNGVQARVVSISV
ncbi:sestrin-2-like [Penaeus monodon]|uniref:sestrin-2-like n=1 Tax=Penaeus monodon TaxID=6687 RepID=UPI0018A6EDBD|nr:sestrin-2-like [Penaeus monodon]